MRFIIFCLLTILIVTVIVLKGRKTENFYESNEVLLVGGLLLTGILVRVVLFWEYPAGFNQDEASIGYDAYADFMYGVDRNGYHNPVYSVAWGSGHSGLYIGLLRLSVSVLGLSVFSVRLINCVFGCVALLAFYGTLRRLRGIRPALVGLFFIIINPWHIMMSRWGLECNLFPNVFVIGLYFLVRGRENELWYPLSMFFFGLSLYAYGTACIFVPVFLLTAAVYMLRHKQLKKASLLISGGIFLLTAIPIALFLAINLLELSPMDWGFLSFPRLIKGRYHTTLTIMDGSIIKNMFLNLVNLCRLLMTQSDGLPWNSIPGFGIMYIFSLPFVLIGIESICRRKEHQGRLLLFTMGPAALVLAAVSDLNINRANIIILLLVYLGAEGIYTSIRRVKKLTVPVIGLYAVCFCLFTGVYFTDYQKIIGHYFFHGFGEAIILAADKTNKTVYLSDTVNAPYIYALFYEKTDPHIFMETVEYKNPESSVRQVASFDRFVTGLPAQPDGEEEAAYVANIAEAAAFDDALFNKEKIGLYYAIYPK